MKKIDPSVYLFSLGHLSVDWCQGAIPALLPYFIRNYDLSYQAAGTLVFANVLVASVLQPMFGYYSDRISRPWFIPLGTLFCGMAVALMGFCTSFSAIFAAAMLCGVGSAVFHPEAALMVNRMAAKAKGQALGTFSVGGNAGFAIGPIAAGICAYRLGIHTLLVFGIVNAVLALALWTKMPYVLRQVALAGGQETEKSTVKARENNWKAFGILSMPIFARSIGFTLSNTFIPIYWMTVLHASATQGTTALSFLFTLGACITFGGGLLADRFDSGGSGNLYAVQSYCCFGTNLSCQKCRVCFRRNAGADYDAGWYFCAAGWRNGRQVGAGSGFTDILDCRPDWFSGVFFPAGT